MSFRQPLCTDNTVLEPQWGQWLADRFLRKRGVLHIDKYEHC